MSLESNGISLSKCNSSDSMEINTNINEVENTSGCVKIEHSVDVHVTNGSSSSGLTNQYHTDEGEGGGTAVDSFKPELNGNTSHTDGLNAEEDVWIHSSTLINTPESSSDCKNESHPNNNTYSIYRLDSPVVLEGSCHGDNSVQEVAATSNQTQMSSSESIRTNTSSLSSTSNTAIVVQPILLDCIDECEASKTRSLFESQQNHNDNTLDICNSNSDHDGSTCTNSHTKINTPGSPSERFRQPLLSNVDDSNISSDDDSTSSASGFHVNIEHERRDSSDYRGTCTEDNDTIASRLDITINRINHHGNNGISGSSSTCTERRKESFEQMLKRRFTIKDQHTNEVAKRIVALAIKYSLFVFNFVSWIIAIAAIGFGIWMRNDKTFFVTSDTEFYFDLPLVTCIGGAVTFVVAFLGCVGALRERLILLRVFFYVLTVILLGEMVLTTAVFIIYTVPEARDNFLRSQPEKILTTAIQTYMDDKEVMEWVDKIQSKFKCCGISHTDEGFRDWKMNQYYNCSATNRSIYRCAVPTSCCIFEKGDRVNIMCGFDMTDKPLIEVRDYIHTRGCIIGFGEWLENYHSLIIISCLAVIIMQFLAVLSAKLMVIRIRKQRSRWRLLEQSASAGSSFFTTSRDL